MTPESFILEPRDWVPNNPGLPVLVYRRALQAAGALDPGAAETLLARNRWPARWRDGIFDYHHYHSTAHEVLAVFRGGARVVLGGPGGREVELAIGDVVVLPAGTGHRRLRESVDFAVIGAYPEGQMWDICRDAADAARRARIARVPFPASDPLSGPGGPLTRLWAAPGGA